MSHFRDIASPRVNSGPGTWLKPEIPHQPDRQPKSTYSSYLNLESSNSWQTVSGGVGWVRERVRVAGEGHLDIFDAAPTSWWGIWCSPWTVQNSLQDVLLTSVHTSTRSRTQHLANEPQIPTTTPYQLVSNHANPLPVGPGGYLLVFVSSNRTV